MKQHKLPQVPTNAAKLVRENPEPVKMVISAGFKKYGKSVSKTEIEINGVVKDVFSTLLHNTEPFDLTGLPAIVFPCGFDKENLPVSIQLVAKSFKEEKILSLANYYQKETDWHKLIPTF